MDEKRQVQKELFEDFIAGEKKTQARDLLQKKSRVAVNLYFEHVVFLLIGLIIVMAVMFSFGVERGKTVSLSLKSSGETIKHEKASLERETASPVLSQQKVLEEPAAFKEDDKLKSHFEFTVQVASYRREDTAMAHAERLKAHGNDAFTLKRGDYYITCVGKFKDRQSADTELKKLRKSYSDCIVRKI